MPGFVFAADLEGLFDVWRRVAQGFDFVQVGERCYFLTARGRIAAVGLRGSPCERLLRFDGQLEELGRGVKDTGAGCSRDGDVLEVDEAGGLEAREDGFGCLGLLGVVAIEEFGEVDELLASEGVHTASTWASVLPG